MKKQDKQDKQNKRTQPASPERPVARTPQGQTLPAQGERQEDVPRMPYEHDESADSQSREQSSAQDIGRIAHHDAKRGMPDTSKARELDRTYDRLREDLPDGKKKRIP
jgi:hypothetical protein